MNKLLPNNRYDSCVNNYFVFENSLPLTVELEPEFLNKCGTLQQKFDANYSFLIFVDFEVLEICNVLEFEFSPLDRLNQGQLLGLHVE